MQSSRSKFQPLFLGWVVKLTMFSARRSVGAIHARRNQQIREYYKGLNLFFTKQSNHCCFLFQACPLKKGVYYYMHDFKIIEENFPMPLPMGEFRLDVNASVIEGK